MPTDPTDRAAATKRVPMLRHPYCQIRACPVCLEDHDALLRYLDDVLGQPAWAGDNLGAYRSWLDETGRVAEPETKWGWADPKCFDPDILEDYINDRTTPLEDPS